MTDYATIRVDREGPLATLTLNRPEHRNGMSNRMVRETCEALGEIAGDGVTRVLVLTGAGDSFCPGADMGLSTVAAQRMPFSDFIALETERHLQIGRMQDTREAFRAFLEKRAPVFSGR